MAALGHPERRPWSDRHFVFANQPLGQVHRVDRGGDAGETVHRALCGRDLAHRPQRVERVEHDLPDTGQLLDERIAVRSADVERRERRALGHRGRTNQNRVLNLQHR